MDNQTHINPVRWAIVRQGPYKYNAEAGEFDTGNDVALCSSLFSVSAASVAPVLVDEHTEHVLDAAQIFGTACDRYQLSANLSQQDPDWAAGSPQITYSSEDPTIATVTSDGLVTFQPSIVDLHECLILAVATEDGKPTQTLEFRLSGVAHPDTLENYVPETITSENVGDYVLVLYNADSTDSTNLATYYKNNRPGMENATYLGLTAGDEGTEGTIAWIYNHNNPNLHLFTIPDTAGTSAASQAICEAIADYVATWVEEAEQNDSSLSFRYVVGLCGLPSRYVCDRTLYNIPSVSYMIYSELLVYSGKSGYTNGMDRFSVAEYGAPLIAWLDCGSYDATKAYINKEKVAAAAGGLQDDGITISGSKAGVGGTTYYLDDTTNYFARDYFDTPDSGNYYSALVAEGVSPDDIVHDSKADNLLITALTDPTAYGSCGTHSGPLDDDWPTLDEVTIALNNTCQIGTTNYRIGWWVGMSVESFNGIYGCFMADPVDVFAANAFAASSAAVTATINGTDYTYYANTPICWVGSTSEPGEGGCEGAAYFERWAQHWSTLDAAWAGRRTNSFVTVTDICLTQ